MWRVKQNNGYYKTEEVEILYTVRDLMYDYKVRPVGSDEALSISENDLYDSQEEAKEYAQEKSIRKAVNTAEDARTVSKRNEKNGFSKREKENLYDWLDDIESKLRNMKQKLDSQQTAKNTNNMYHCDKCNFYTESKKGLAIHNGQMHG